VTASGPRPWPLLGNVVPLVRDPLGFMEGLQREHGDTARFSIGSDRYLLVSDPVGIRQVLVERHRNYIKGPGYDGVRLVMGEGMITSEGDAWQEQRRQAQPAFRRESIAAMAAIVEDEAELSANALAARVGQVVDVHRETVRFTLQVLGRVLFGASVPTALIAEVMPVLLDFANDHGNEPFHLPLWTPFPSHLRFGRARRRLDAAVDALIAARRVERGDDLLSRLMGEEGEPSVRALRDRVITLLLAGHETTATSLAVALHALSQQPAEAERCRSEAASPPQQRRRCAAVFLETLRLYPPVWIVERRALEDDVVGGEVVPAGTMVAVAPWVVHRDPRWWPDPLAFLPDRFDESEPDSLTFLSFLVGPRGCIGKHLAMLEAAIFLPTVLQRLRFEAVGELAFDAGISLRPRGGVRLRLHERPS
jgi:enediyne biosynthesis protein E7